LVFLVVPLGFNEKKNCWDELIVGVLTRSGFLVFGQNRGLELGYPSSWFWATGNRGPDYWLVLVCTRSGNQFFGLILGIEHKISPFFLHKVGPFFKKYISLLVQINLVLL
jgi:hypothetical protein